MSRVSLKLIVLAVLASAVSASAAGARPFAFQPIAIKRIDLPKAVKSAGWPVFAHDGHHLLFFSTGSGTAGAGSTGRGATAELWITGLDGGHARCLSCGKANDPTSQGEGEVTPFPDGKRVFFGSFRQPGASHYGVLECTPSVADCRRSKILPVDFSAAEPLVIPPGGPEATPQLNAGGAYGAKLAQDGRHVGFSDIRTDSVEMMVVGTMTRTAGAYRVTDPRVINPATPLSPTDANAAAWSDAGALYEFKTFTHGGADATYVQVGGAALGNPDVWSVNLATGRRTRLTAHADYDEDNAVSPDGSLMALWSNRTMHMSDWFGGLLPVRDFIDLPSSLMALPLSSSNKRCHGPIWIMPSGGDAGGTLAGQPIVDDRLNKVFITNNLTGWPQWSPDGTMLALNTTRQTAGTGYPAHAPYALVARFAGHRPTSPLRAVSSQPGAWAVAPTSYHTIFGFTGTRTFAGPGGGTVSVDYGLTGRVDVGQWSETYTRYSDDGKSFVDGTVTIHETAAGVGTYASHLTMTGAHRGTTDITDDTAGAASGTSTYDGHTVSGPSAEQAAGGACPDLYPKTPKLAVSRTRIRGGAYRIRVTASIGAMGVNESQTDVQPVQDATIELHGHRVHTDASGVATVRGGGTATVTAGDTLKATTIRLAAR